MTTGEGYTLEGFLVVGVIIGLVLLAALGLTILDKGTNRLLGRVPSVRQRRDREALLRAERWQEHDQERQARDWSRAELVRSWRIRDLPVDQRINEYHAWVVEHGENNPFPFHMLGEWEERFGPNSPSEDT